MGLCFILSQCVGELDQSNSAKSLFHCQHLFIHFQSSHLDDLLDSEPEPCCNWEAVAKRQAKEIEQLKKDNAMYEARLQSDVQFVSEFKQIKSPDKLKVIHNGTQTDEQGRLHFYALTGPPGSLPIVCHINYKAMKD